jgi:two-component system phosphate regulon sensor histidine kinase PhoR
VSLFLEKIQFKQFLSHEIDLFRYPHPRIQIISNIDASIRFIEIDKIQIQQVITNLLDNAVKFAQNDTPIISVSALKIWNTIEIRIEDNGVGFDGIDIQEVFNKYAIGSKWAVWLGMGLYLCERIITMHRGSIVASLSWLYWWACFTIILPIK